MEKKYYSRLIIRVISRLMKMWLKLFDSCEDILLTT